MTYSEHELEFTFAKNTATYTRVFVFITHSRGKLAALTFIFVSVGFAEFP